MPMLTLFIALSTGAPAGPLRARTLASDSRIPSSLIIGRTVCSGATWLLMERLELVVVTHATRQVVTRAVKGLQAADRPWGLACLADGTLWTLATSRTLVRISAEGTIRERIDLQFPRLVIFGWRDRLLFVQLPVLVAKPLLSSSPPRVKTEPRPWPRFVGRATETRQDFLARNLVNCGIGNGINLPCWFADERRAIVSDGSTSSAISFAALYAPDVDASAPIWDLAIGATDSFWLLPSTTGAAGEHTAGARLFKTDVRGVERASIALTPRARMILAANDVTCLLLTVDGRLMEVAGP